MEKPSLGALKNSPGFSRSISNLISSPFTSTPSTPRKTKKAPVVTPSNATPSKYAAEDNKENAANQTPSSPRAKMLLSSFSPFSRSSKKLSNREPSRLATAAEVSGTPMQASTPTATEAQWLPRSISFNLYQVTGIPAAEERARAMGLRVQELSSKANDIKNFPKKRRVDGEEEIVDSPVKRLRSASVSASLAALSSADPTSLFSSSSSAPLLASERGYTKEGPVAETYPTLVQSRSLSNALSFYKKEHENYCGTIVETGVHMILSISRDAAEEVIAILRTNEGDRELLRSTLGEEKKRLLKGDPALKDVVAELLPTLDSKAVSWKKYKVPGFSQELERIDQMQLTSASRFKFGVMYAKEGQMNEDDIFANQLASPAFDNFLKILGDVVAMKGWKNYKAGLDIRCDTTGTHSVYTQWNGSEVMFHVSTMLPFSPTDGQQIERKRHIGNDICVIVFSEGSTPFAPQCLTSHFNHIFVVIRPVFGENGAVQYRVEIARKSDVPAFGPTINADGVYDAASLRSFLLTKLITGERTALQLAPEFARKNVRTRTAQIRKVVAEFCRP